MKGAETGKQPSIQKQRREMEENGCRWKTAAIVQRGNNVQYKTTCAPRRIRAVRLRRLLPFPHKSIKIAEFPIAIKLPDSSIIWSMHTYNLDISWLLHEMTEAHIVPGLEHSSLISIQKCCKAGCKVVFGEQECRVYYKNELVLSVDRDKKT